MAWSCTPGAAPVETLPHDKVPKPNSRSPDSLMGEGDVPFLGDPAEPPRGHHGDLVVVQ